MRRPVRILGHYKFEVDSNFKVTYVGEANETIIVDQEKVIKYADEHNIVIMAV